jgi:flagellar biosynthesis component FlhA
VGWLSASSCMAWMPARAFETYAILTVGDGLVSQIPA